MTDVTRITPELLDDREKEINYLLDKGMPVTRIPNEEALALIRFARAALVVRDDCRSMCNDWNERINPILVEECEGIANLLDAAAEGRE